MSTRLSDPVDYFFRLDKDEIHLNPFLNKEIKLLFHGNITCINCGRTTNKSFNQGHCFPCMRKLASCDLCVLSPERCHYDQGTCREPEWGEQFCMQNHIVYLANSSGIKVGITRVENTPSRWIDQGAVQALPILRVQSRYQSGLVEMIYKAHISDKTSWQRMLKNEAGPVPLQEERDRLAELVKTQIADLQEKFGIQAVSTLDEGELHTINYPVSQYPTKVVSLNFDKQAEIEGTLLGIKGQYLIFDRGVINIRKFTAYEVELFA